MTEIKTPDCPSCGHPPRLTFVMPYFCENLECNVMSWPPEMTLAEIRKLQPDVIDIDLEFKKVEHVAAVVPVQKMDLYGPAFKGACSCGWRSDSGPTTEHNAWKNAQQHVDAKNKAA